MKIIFEHVMSFSNCIYLAYKNKQKQLLLSLLLLLEFSVTSIARSLATTVILDV